MRSHFSFHFSSCSAPRFLSATTLHYLSKTEALYHLIVTRCATRAKPNLFGQENKELGCQDGFFLTFKVIVSVWPMNRYNRYEPWGRTSCFRPTRFYKGAVPDHGEQAHVLELQDIVRSLKWLPIASTCRKAGGTLKFPKALLSHFPIMTNALLTLSLLLSIIKV